jgi:DTW domain-containing protein
METATRIVLLMHPMEWRRQKCNTGRLTSLNLANSEIIPGIRFDSTPRVRALVDDPGNLPVLLYPGRDAVDLASGALSADALAGRRLVVFLIDATWACARTVARQSPGLLRLPRLAITPMTPSRYRIRRQPAPWCLSTLEAVHELLMALEAAGLDSYPDKERLLDVFNAMQDHQISQMTAKARVRLPGCQAAEREAT